MPKYIELSADETITTAELIGHFQTPAVQTESEEKEEEADETWQ